MGLGIRGHKVTQKRNKNYACRYFIYGEWG